MNVVSYLLPFEFSPAMLAGTVAGTVLYARAEWFSGNNGQKSGIARPLAFCTGLLLAYAVMQTYFDYLSQHMFWVHRLQHLVLHHVSPFLIVLGARQLILEKLRRSREPSRSSLPLRAIASVYRVLQCPPIAAFLFGGLVYFWLIPGIHFDAMLSADLYAIMNWSMLLDGLLFWWLILDPRDPGPDGSLGFGVRVIMLWAVMFAQIGLGAYIALSGHVIYDSYAVCGRAWSISPLVDQQYGGLLTWIPPAMMSVVGGLVVLRQWLGYESRKERLPDTDTVKPAVS